MGWFIYRREILDYVKEKKTIAGLRAPHWAHFLAIDIDKEKLEDARALTDAMLCMLLEEYDIDTDKLHIFFSGNKGFHILLPGRMFSPTPDKYCAKIFKQFAMELLGTDDVDTQIYEPLRLLRLPNTKHKKSGLYKIPIHAHELSLDVNELRALASEPRLNFPLPEKSELNTTLKDIYENVEAETKKRLEKSTLTVSTRTGGVRPKDKVKLCYISMLRGIAAGERNEVAVRLASHFRKQGFAESAAIALLRDWDMRNNPPCSNEGEEDELLSTARSAYNNENIDYGCFDTILKNHCDPHCHLAKEKKSIQDGTCIKTLKEVATAYANRSRLDKGIKFNIPEIDRATRGLMPGHVLQYLARTGTGKTAFAIHLMRQLSNQKKWSLFFSLEMPIEEVFEREVQMTKDIAAIDVETFAKDLIRKGFTDEEVADKFLEKTDVEEFGHLLIVDKSSVSIKEIEEITKAAREKWDIEAIFVDYLSRMSAFGNSYERISFLAREIKSLARRLELPIIYLNQTNRSVTSAADIPSLSDSRDSGQTEEAADIIISSSRPRNLEFRVHVLKNRRGAEGMTITLYFDPIYMRFSDHEITEYSIRTHPVSSLQTSEDTV